MKPDVRPYAGASDLPLIAALMRVVSPLTPHLLDHPWRLASPAAETGRDVAVCRAPDESLTGLAAWQAPWAVLDLFVRPGAEHDDTATALLAWAETRFRELDSARGRALPYWVEARDGDAARLTLLARHGYTFDTDYGYNTLGRTLVTTPTRAEPPHGFELRPLGGVADIEAYVQLHQRTFESATMTSAWRARTLQLPGYWAALDLVAAAPDGRLAAFCVGWFDPHRGAAQIEPFGVDPDFRGRGLGRALLSEALRRFKAHGAREVFVEPEHDNLPALRTYAAVGFRPQGRVLRKGRWLAEPLG